MHDQAVQAKSKDSDIFLNVNHWDAVSSPVRIPIYSINFCVKVNKMTNLQILARVLCFLLVTGSIGTGVYFALFFWMRKPKPLDCGHALAFQKWYDNGNEYDVQVSLLPFCQGTSPNVNVWTKPTLPLINETEEQFLSRCKYKTEQANCLVVPPKKDEDKEAWIERCQTYKDKSFCLGSYDFNERKGFPQKIIYTPTKDEYLALCAQRGLAGKATSAHCERQYNHWVNQGKKPMFVKSSSK